jgi:cytosine/adenosine deaminase-related metal-dependent hydrolase
MLQYLAQGGNMAIEDAVCLANQIEASGQNYEAAFRKYQNLRYLRTARVQLMARVFGEVYHASGVNRELRNKVLGEWAEQGDQGGCRHGEPYFFKNEALGLNVQICRVERDVLEAIIEEAHKHGLKVTVHTFDQEAAIEALEAGADGLEHGIMDHRLSGDRVVELLLRNHASYVPTWLLGFEEKASEVRYANLKRIADAGVRVALGSDSFCGFGKFGENTIVEAERSAAAEIAPLAILKMATKDAAEHLGTEDLGVVAPGKLADLLLLDGDPTRSIGALRKLSLVIQNAAIVVDNVHMA